MLPVDFFDDFVTLRTSDVWQLHTVGVGSTCALVNGEDDVLGGVLALGVSAPTLPDNYMTDLKLVDGDAGAPFKITKDSGKKLWFEARVRLLEVAVLAAYVGLFNPEESAFGEGLGLVDTGLPNFDDGVYFRVLCDVSTAIDWAHSKNGTETEKKAGILTNDAGWHTLGFYFDGVNTITPIIDGIPQPDYAVDADHANFPNDLALLPHLYIQTAAEVAKTLRVDWIRVMQGR